MSVANNIASPIDKRLAGTSVDVRIELLAVTGITILAAVLRFYRLGNWSFWIDEIFTIGRVQAHVDLKTLSAVTHPPSILFTAAMFQLFGVNEWSARLFPAIAGFITVPLLYLAIRKPFGYKVALVSVLLLAVAPWHLFWSQNARYYATLMLFYALAAFAFYDGLERDRPWQFLIFYVLFYLAVKERFTSLFLVPVVGAYLVLLWLLPRLRPPGFRARNLALLLIPFGLGALAMAYQSITTDDFALVSIWQHFFGFPNISPLRLLLAIVYRIGVPLVVLGAFAGAYMALQRSRAVLFTLLAAVVPIVLLVLLSPFAFTVDRYVFATLPFWAILGALSVVTLGEWLQGPARLLALSVLLMLLASSVGDLMLYYEYQNGQRPDWKAAYALVDGCRQANDTVVSTRPEVGDYYLSDDVGNVNRLQVDELEEKGTRVWIVIDEATGPLDPVIGNWVSRNARLVDVNSVFVPGKSLSIRTYLYPSEGAGFCATDS